jgi:beta-mannosidase
MFACSSYPENDHFIENVRQEAREKVAELQHHPSIALWCGNNENEWTWYRGQKRSYRNMPGFNIFHHELKSIVEELDPQRPYWPTTPFGSEEDPNATASGNRHSWDIWSCWVDYLEVEKDDSLFVSEFGFQGPANISTLNSILDQKNRHVQDEIFEFHNKQVEGNERLFKFLAGHLPVRTEWEDFIYLTQLNQGFALKTCLEHWRSRWPETAGSIIWQLNDCWPVTSWSLIDSHLNPKLSYFFVKGVFSDPALFIKKEGNQIKTMITNESEENFAGKLEYSVLNLLNNQDIKKEKKDITIRKGEKKSGETISIDELPESGNWIFITTLYNKEGYIYKRNYYTIKKWKHLKMSASDINITKSGEDKLSIETNSLALFVDLYHDQYRFSDRGFIMLPGEKIDLDILSGDLNKFDVSDVRIFALNDYLQ